MIVVIPATTDYSRLVHIAGVLVILGWPISLYIAAREATTPAPQQRYPALAVTMFSIAIIGNIAAVSQSPFELSILEDGTPSYVFFLTAAAVGVGLLASFWLAADALVKAETGRTWSADPPETMTTTQLIGFLPVGIWFLHPRIRRLLAPKQGQDLA